MGNITEKPFSWSITTAATTAGKYIRSVFKGTPNIFAAQDVNRQFESVVSSLGYTSNKVGPVTATLIVNSDSVVATSAGGGNWNLRAINTISSSSGLPRFYYLGHLFDVPAGQVDSGVVLVDSSSTLYLFLVAKKSLLSFSDDPEMSGVQGSSGEFSTASSDTYIYSEERVVYAKNSVNISLGAGEEVICKLGALRYVNHPGGIDAWEWQHFFMSTSMLTRNSSLLGSSFEVVGDNNLVEAFINIKAQVKWVYELFTYNLTYFALKAVTITGTGGLTGGGSLSSNRTISIASNGVTNAKMADLSVGTAELINYNVTSAKLGTGAVTNAKLYSSAVTTAKINNLAVTEAKLAAGAVATAKIEDGAVTEGKISNGAVTNDKIALNTITQNRIAADSIGTSELQVDSVIEENISSSAVTTAKIKDANVTKSKMAANSVDSAQYVDGSIDRVHLAADIVDGTKIADDSINSEHYVDLSIDRAHISNLAIDSGKLDVGAVTSAKLADTSVNSQHYVDGSVDAVHLAASSVTEAKFGSSIKPIKIITSVNLNYLGSQNIYLFSSCLNSPPGGKGMFMPIDSENQWALTANGLYFRDYDSGDEFWNSWLKKSN